MFVCRMFKDVLNVYLLRPERLSFKLRCRQPAQMHIECKATARPDLLYRKLD